MVELFCFLLLATPVLIGLSFLVGLVGGNILNKRQEKLKNEIMEKFVRTYGYEKLKTLLCVCEETGANMTSVMSACLQQTEENPGV